MTSLLLAVDGLTTVFDTHTGPLVAVKDVSLSLRAGEVLGLVGESGSGKSVLAYSILRLIDPPGRITAGQIRFQDFDIGVMSERQLRALRGDAIAMIFQDPMMSLNPVLKVGTQMIETIRAHRKVPVPEARALARDTLGKVGIPSPEERLNSYPHEFSGGMRQRVAIAIALLNDPKIIIADEPTTALDVTIQAQIIDIARTLRDTLNVAFIWITHDLSLLDGFADRLAVMYAGQLVEYGEFTDLIRRPAHPYTRGLINCLPSQNRGRKRLYQIPGMAPSLSTLPRGCAFRPRCGAGTTACAAEPQLDELAAGRLVRCFHPMVEASA